MAQNMMKGPMSMNGMMHQKKGPCMGPASQSPPSAATNNMMMGRGEMTPKDLMSMIMGFQQTQVINAASSLGIFDELHRTGEPMSARAVANRLRTDHSATERLLNTTTGMGLTTKLTQGDHSKEAVYMNTPLTAMMLVKSSPMSIRPLLANINDMYRMFGQLGRCVREGHTPSTMTADIVTPDDETNHNNEEDQSNSNSTMFGEDGYYLQDSRKVDFMAAMHLFSKMDAPHATHAFDLSQYSTICDIGGGTGALGCSLAQTYPDHDVIVAELDRIVDIADHFIPENKPSNLTFQAADMFTDDLPPADLYILSHVIHDWSQDRVECLLERIYKALPSGGALLVLEKMLNETKDGPLPTLMMDLSLMLGAEGKERSSVEYKELLQKKGFRDVQMKILPPMVQRDAILSRKY